MSSDTQKTNPFSASERAVIDILTVKHQLNGTSAPLPTHDMSKGYVPRSLWIDKILEKVYICINAKNDEAEWIEFGGDSFTTGLNVGTGRQIFKDKISSVMRFRSLVSSDTISSVLDEDNIQLNVKDGLTASKIADGSVDDTEFASLNGVTGNLQDQIDELNSLLGSTVKSSVETSNSSWTQIGLVNTTTETVYQIEARIVARRTDVNGEGASYILNATYRRDGNSIIKLGEDKLQLEDTLSWDVEMSNSGTDIVVNVKGELGKTIFWNATIKSLSA